MDDRDNLIGDRFLCAGGTLLLAGASGIGKSTLALQMVGSFALKRPFLGIKPKKALKTLYVQAENDFGDIAEICIGLRQSLSITPGSKEEEQLCENLKVYTEDSQAGEGFIRSLASLLQAEAPDLILVDPLLSYIGGDINQQSVVSEFLRMGLNPLLHKHKTACVMVHHTKKGGASDSYAALGSSEIINYSRCVMTLTPAKKGSGYDLSLEATKRGSRLGLRDSFGSPAEQLRIRYADTPYLSFEVVKDIEPAAKPPAKTGPKPKYDRDTIREYLKGVTDKKEAIAKILETEGCSEKQARRIADEILL